MTSEVPPEPDERAGFGRRRFLGYVLAAPVLTVAARMTLDAPGAHAATTSGVPSGPQLSDVVDLNDLLTDATLPTANLITVVVNTDGTASFALPRAESGQGITTSSAMLVAEELDLPLDKIRMTLADARPELVFNQFTAGSNTTISTYTPIRVAAALARRRLLQAAAIEFGDEVTNLRTSLGTVIASNGRSASYGSLAAKAASATVSAQSVTLKDPSEFTVIGTPQNRIDALAAVTGRKQYAMDLDVAGALPTMICRAPTINGTVQSVRNAAQVRAMPGITHVVTIPTGVAVRGQTFGQVIDAVRALDVSWGAGSVDGESDATVLTKLEQAELPLAVPKVPVLAKTLDARFTFSWRSNSALEPQTAVADVHGGKAEVWSAMQSPILTQETVAKALGLPADAVTAHVVQAGGAFGRRMFSNVVVEAAQVSQQIGEPVKLMWDRTAEFRYGRVHPMCISRVRATVLGGNVLSFEQRHTSVATDYTQGFGEILLNTAGKLPEGNFLGFSQTVFETTTNVPYNFGAVTQLLNEVFEYDTFHSGSVRNLYNPEVVTAVELMVDQIARVLGRDPYQLRRDYVKDPRARAVLDKVAQVGSWGRRMPAGTAQGLAMHAEYKGVTACLVEIDNTPATVNRTIRDAVTGPRVTKVVFAIDAGLAVNPRGLEAQMMGGINSAVGQVLTESLHLKDGHFLEGSWDNYFYT
ncbi:MAG: molybdopterin cofactor-binding domain-containing protein, partial [Mycobacteriales bacterium]